MTALYAILAVLLLGGAYDRRLPRRLWRRRDGGGRHAITHADLVQMEQEAINKQKEQQ